MAANGRTCGDRCAHVTEWYSQRLPGVHSLPAQWPRNGSWGKYLNSEMLSNTFNPATASPLQLLCRRLHCHGSLHNPSLQKYCFLTIASDILVRSSSFVQYGYAIGTLWQLHIAALNKFYYYVLLVLTLASKHEWVSEWVEFNAPLDTIQVISEAAPQNINNNNNNNNNNK